MPELMPANNDAMFVYMRCHTQLIFAGMSGVPIDIDHSAVWKIIDEYNIEPRTKVFEKVVALAQAILDRQRKRIEHEMSVKK